MVNGPWSSLKKKRLGDRRVGGGLTHPVIYPDPPSAPFRCSTRALACTVIRFVSINAKFGICTVVGLNGTLVEGKIRTWDTRMCVTFRPKTV
jgi:hypothetical protein